MLYPDCSGAAHTAAECYKSKHYIGWIRLFVYLGIPCGVTLLLLVLLSSFLRRIYHRKLHAAKVLGRWQLARLGLAHEKLSEQEKRTSQLQTELQRERLSKEKSVRRRVREIKRQQRGHASDDEDAQVGRARSRKRSIFFHARSKRVLPAVAG